MKKSLIQRIASWLRLRVRLYAIYRELGYNPWRKPRKARKEDKGVYIGIKEVIPFVNGDAKRTFSHLLFRPGYMMRDYILRGQHERYLAPFTALVLVAVGLKGNAGMVAAMVIGGVVCTALSTAGGLITDFKIGYWIGTTPKKQEAWKFVGIAVAAATVGGVMLILNKTYGFTGEGALVAPQANAMAAVIQPMMNGGSAPWLLYGIGALMGVVSAILKFAKVDWFMNAWNTVAPGHVASGAEAVAILPLIALCAYMIWSSLKTDK